MILLFLLILYIIYALSSSYLLYYLIYNKLVFLKKEDGVQIDEKYRPFIRHNLSTINIPSMFFCCIFLIPARLTLIFIAYLINYIPAKIILMGDKNYAENQYTPWKRKFL